MTSARLTISPLQSAQHTADNMARLVRDYSGDIGERSKWPLIRFFNYVKNLPYRADPPGNETISRPALTMRPEWPARDCDDKAILLASWLQQNGKPWRFVASSTRADGELHHVYLVGMIDGREIVLDATYPNNQFGETPAAERQTRRVYLNGWQNMNTLSVFEGDQLGFSIRKSIKKVGKAASKSARSAVSSTKKAAVQVRRGKVLSAGKTLVKAGAKPVQQAALKQVRQVKSGVSATKKAAVQVRQGKVLSAGKTLVKAGAKPVQQATAVLARNMPDAIKNKIKALVLKMAGGKVTSTTKAYILPTVTAAALAIPGVQPFAPAVGAVVNVALDEMISSAKNQAKNALQSAKKKGADMAAAQTAPQSAASSASARAQAVRDKLQAAVETAQETAQETAAGMSTGKKMAIAGGIAAVAIIAMKGRKK